MVINLVVLPGVTKFFRTKYEISGPELDIQTLRASLPFLVLGLFLIALADTPGFFFFGELPQSIRTLLWQLTRAFSYHCLRLWGRLSSDA